MPTGYQTRILNREGQTCTHKVATVVFNADFKVVDDSLTTYTSTPIRYFPTAIDFKVKSTPTGWDDDTDELIWVDTDLDISTRNKYDTDEIIINSREYYVSHVRRMDFYGHYYKLIGLYSKSNGGIS